MTVDYVVRVKLPSSSGYASCPSGDTDYESDYNKAIFAVKPDGFEISWATKNIWPIDKDGKTWVLMYCTDSKKAVEYFNGQIDIMERRLKKFEELSNELNKI